MRIRAHLTSHAARTVRAAGGRVLLAAGLLVAVFAAAAPARADIASWIVFDAGSGRVVEQRNAFRRWYPASLTKLMTAYVTFEAMKAGRFTPGSAVTVSANAAAQPPSKMGLKPGTSLSLDAALKVLLVKSANDIALAVAETVGGSEAGFARLMNQTARRLGMRDSHFVNPHGLPDNSHISSAYDMALLAHALLRDFPQYREYYGYAGVQFGKGLMRSANREFLSRVRGADGLKTGYICNSGYNVAASATRGGRTVVAIVFGAASGLERAAKSRQLIEKGFAGRGLFGGGGKTLQQMSRPAKVKGLPADGYCKRNKEPSLAQMLKTYGTPASLNPAGALPGVTTAYAVGNSSRLLPAPAGTTPAKAQKVEIPRKANNKIDWGEVMDRMIGERRAGDRLVRVTLAVTEEPKRDKTVADAFGAVLPPPLKPEIAGSAAAAAAAAPVAVLLPARAADGTPTPRPHPAR